MNSATIVQKLWNYCNVLRDDGMSYGDYVEQLTYQIKGVSDNYCVRAKKYVGDPLVHCSQESNGSGSYFSEVPIQPAVPAVFALKCPSIKDF